ncbi:MAG: PDZ domain-containing protein, partial [Oscillospiraceae bacterium]|nr:PDZ domain-containing protein [Oscillospiraceae bacterium]
MSVLISAVVKNSIAARQGILPGHRLLRINTRKIRDVLDYRFHMSGDRLSLELENESGEPYEVSIKKREYGDLGLEFETYLIDKQQNCRNRCVFCFIDQLPPGLRESLYFKDDDSRLSFLFGNYITLTNLSDEDIARIIEMRLSPVNISVHTTDSDLRVRMMGNPRAGEVLSYIPRLANANIRINAQIVLCPGYNDGAELERSLRGL